MRCTDSPHDLQKLKKAKEKCKKKAEVSFCLARLFPLHILSFCFHSLPIRVCVGVCVCVCVCVCLIRILVTDVIGAGQGPESAKNACGSVIAKTVRCETGIRLLIDRQQHEQSMKSQRNPVS